MTHRGQFPVSINLFHHYVTEVAGRVHIWAGCGYICKVFLELGVLMNHTENLSKISWVAIYGGVGSIQEHQVKHLRDGPSNLLKSDFFDRPPWTRVNFRDRHFINDLNLDSQAASVPY
jgi:hypothetical protein